MQCVYCLLRQFNWYKQMVVMDAGNDIATDFGSCKRLRERGGQANGSKIRVDSESDPGGGKRNRQAKIKGVLFREDNRKPFRFVDGCHDKCWVERKARRKGYEYIAAGIEFRLHVGQEFFEIRGDLHSNP